MAVSVGPDGSWGVRDSIDIAKYLFNQYVTINTINNELQAFITKYCSQAGNFQWSIETQIMNVENKELVYIEMTIWGGSLDKSFVQKFLLGS